MKPTKSKTEKARARKAKWRAECITSQETKLPLALAYEAETKRVRKASGIEEAKQRIEEAQQAAEDALARVAQYPVQSLAGLVAKGQFFATSDDHCINAIRLWHRSGSHGTAVLGYGYGLAEDIRRVAGKAVAR